MTDNINLFDFDNTYIHLPGNFYHRWMPIPVSNPQLISFNHELAEELLMENRDKVILAKVFSGNIVPAGAYPIAQAYAGHQFGYFVPQLGDGRALLLGEVIDRQDIRRDIQLKGSGQTPFSRMGDGRAGLGPVMREYIVSEAMHKLGIRTTRSLAAVTTGEPVYRETILPGAVLSRVAASHIRIGTFEYFAASGDQEFVQVLADYVINRHYPEAKEAQNPYLALLESIIEAQAQLIASWMHVGFIHGVMNTDNMAISGETIDYGPCAFIDNYDPMMVFSSIDRYGRYAFGNQPPIALWNLTRLAETLLPLLDLEPMKAMAKAEMVLNNFLPHFQQYWLKGMRKKLGLLNEEGDDKSLIEALLNLMHRGNADFTLTFRLLADVVEGKDVAFRQLFDTTQDLDLWIQGWLTRCARQPQSPDERAKGMRLVNPAYIPRNHRIEQAIQAATERQDFSLMERLRQALSRPYVEQDSFTDLMLPPLLSERVEHTFCGT
jgi:serine/tyrosine/threonine adenylyltransferase